MDLTNQQRHHLNEIKARVASRLEEKYVKGQEEHGGNLWDRNNLFELGREITDLITYFHCVENNHRAIVDLVQAIDALSPSISTFLQSTPEQTLVIQLYTQLFNKLKEKVYLYDTRAKISSPIP